MVRCRRIPNSGWSGWINLCVMPIKRMQDIRVETRSPQNKFIGLLRDSKISFWMVRGDSRKWGRGLETHMKVSHIWRFSI